MCYTTCALCPRYGCGMNTTPERGRSSPNSTNWTRCCRAKSAASPTHCRASSPPLSAANSACANPAARAEAFCCSDRRAWAKRNTVVVSRTIFSARATVPLRHVGVSESGSARAAARRASSAKSDYLGAVRERAAEGTLLFDEAEKAHPRVLDLFLQLLDAARITVATGQTLDFSAASTSWLTSNIGSAELMSLQHSNDATLERHVLTRAQQALRPEIFARVNREARVPSPELRTPVGDCGEVPVARNRIPGRARAPPGTRIRPCCRFSCERDFIRSSAHARCAMRWKSSWATPSPIVCSPGAPRAVS